MPKDKPLVYSEDGLKQVDSSLEVLRVDLGASGAMLHDQLGRLLVECGSHGDIDLNAFLTLLSNAMSASGPAMQLLRDVSAFDLHVHEGVNSEIYTTRVSEEVFLTFIFFKKEGASRVGMVWLTLRRAVPELRKLLKRAVVKSGMSDEKEIKDPIGATLNEMPSLADDNAVKKTRPSIWTRAKEPSIETPPPEPSPGETGDPNRTISYEEARRLGYINLDDSKK